MSRNAAHDVERLVELFKAGDWREIRVASDWFSLLLSADPAVNGLSAQQPAVAPVTQRPPVSAEEPVAVAPASVPAIAPPGAIDPSWVAVDAPNLGTFYRSPKPGAPAFVEVGQKVEAGTEVCLIEVMKLFTSVRAAVAGTIRHIAAADAELVEGGQPLMYIERA
jgi:acetyl-CoA carboxylase biotin carboxyl carrier protein